MNSLIKLLQFRFIPFSADCGLLILRLWFGFSMVSLHGWSKLMSFSEKSATFSDPLHVGPTTSMVLAIVGEVLCAILLVLGLFTRFAALGLIINMGVAFFLVHKGILKGQGSGELAFVYLAAYVVLFVAGGGSFSLDAMIGRTSGSGRVDPPR